MNTKAQTTEEFAKVAAEQQKAQLGNQKIVIADTLKRTACKVIDAMRKSYWGRDGLHALEVKVEQKQNELAAGIYDLAVTSCKLGRGYPGPTKDYFSAICRIAEDHLKTEAKVDNLKDALPCWSVYKSEILRGVKIGVKPQDFPTYLAFKAGRKAKDESDAQIESDKRGARPPSGPPAGEGGEGNADAGTTPARVAVTPTLKATMDVMGAVVARMDAEMQDDFADKLSKLVTKYSVKLEGKPKAEVKEEDSDNAPSSAVEAA